MEEDFNFKRNWCCNSCYQQLPQPENGSSQEFFLTTCGHLFHARCLPDCRESDITCPKCLSLCKVTQTTTDLSGVPSNVHEYFGDPVAQITQAMNALKFQLKFYFDANQQLQRQLAAERDGHRQTRLLLDDKERELAQTQVQSNRSQFNFLSKEPPHTQSTFAHTTEPVEPGGRFTSFTSLPASTSPPIPRTRLLAANRRKRTGAGRRTVQNARTETAQSKSRPNVLSKFRYKEGKTTKPPQPLHEEEKSKACEEEPLSSFASTSSTNEETSTRPNTPFYRSVQGGPLLPASPPIEKFEYPLDPIPILPNGLSIMPTAEQSAQSGSGYSAQTTDSADNSFAGIRSTSERIQNKPNERIQMHLAKLRQQSQLQQTTLDSYIKQEPGTEGPRDMFALAQAKFREGGRAFQSGFAPKEE